MQPSTGAPAGGDVELFAADRRDGERLIVAWREFNGFRYLDLRVHYRASDGTWKPTKTGITVKRSELVSVADAMAEACKRAKAVRL